MLTSFLAALATQSQQTQQAARGQGQARGFWHPIQIRPSAGKVVESAQEGTAHDLDVGNYLVRRQVGRHGRADVKAVHLIGRGQRQVPVRTTDVERRGGGCGVDDPAEI